MKVITPQIYLSFGLGLSRSNLQPCHFLSLLPPDAPGRYLKNSHGQGFLHAASGIKLLDPWPPREPQVGNLSPLRYIFREKKLSRGPKHRNELQIDVREPLFMMCLSPTRCRVGQLFDGGQVSCPARCSLQFLFWPSFAFLLSISS